MPSDDDVVHFLRDVKKYELNPEYFMCHSGYLINIASTKDDVWEKSVELLELEMKICAKLGIKYLNIHPGSHLGAGEAKWLLKKITTATEYRIQKGKDGKYFTLRMWLKKVGNIG